jgi:hypothetical protein
MIKKILVFILLANILYAGDDDGISTSGTWVTQGYILESINSTGFNRSIYSHIANLGSTNPAAIYDGNNILAGISYQFETIVKPAWFDDLRHERGHLYLPQSLGIVYPFQSFRIGLGFSQRYNSLLSMPDMIRTTESQPEGS